MGDADRAALEAPWRTRLKNAHLRLYFARSYFKEIKQDFTAADISGPVERFAFDKALRAETAALADYRRISKILTDLTVHGKIPNENEWQRRAVGAG